NHHSSLPFDRRVWR
ncbi:unnamed protein product, partial [Callosobruchus maculatus]